MKLTGAAILVLHGMKVFQAAPAAYPYRSAAQQTGQVVMTWQPVIAETQRLLFVRIGFRRGEIRLFLRAEGDQSPKHVIQLNEVASFYHSLQNGTEIRISEWPEHGSMGWWLPPNDPHQKIKVSGIDDQCGFFLALAKRVEYRFAGGAEALNWPG